MTLSWICITLLWLRSGCAFAPTTRIDTTRTASHSKTLLGPRQPALFRKKTPAKLRMGLLDAFSNFLASRKGDFVKLDDKTFGPGPLMIAYQVPGGIQDEEIQDMIDDTIPPNQQMQWIRLQESQIPSDLTLQQALQMLVDKDYQAFRLSQHTAPTDTQTTPVLFFSGLTNRKMMEIYKTIANEIFLETQAEAACAKAVPNAMNKPLSQVLDEIASDHRDATQSQNS